MHTARASNVVRAECSLFDLSGKILKKYPGYYCAFLKDGSWVSMGIESLSYYSPTDELIWQKIKPYHHMVKADFSEKYIVALSEEGKDVFGCNTRFDTVEKIELKTGKELKYSLVDIVKKINFSSVSLFIKKLKLSSKIRLMIVTPHTLIQSLKLALKIVMPAWGWWRVTGWLICGAGIL